MGSRGSGKSQATAQLLRCLVAGSRGDTDLAKRSLAGLDVLRPLTSSTRLGSRASSNAVGKHHFDYWYLFCLIQLATRNMHNSRPWII